MNRFSFLILLGALPVFGASPLILYTDLNSGPATGGENNLGVYVTVTGRRFGATQGNSAITLGGGAVTVKSWSDSKIVFQPGPRGATGTIAVTVGGAPSACVESGNCDFTVRPGNIYCISNNGSNTNNGHFTAETGGTGCWKGLDYSIRKLNAGDTLYFGANSTDTFQSEPDDAGCNRIGYGTIYITGTCGKAGTAANSIALVGYPGNSATIGGADAQHYGMMAINIGGGVGGIPYWTLANLNFIGSERFFSNGAVVGAQGKGHRIINNDIQLPYAPNSYEGALAISGTHAVEGEGIINRVYGNYVHNVNTINPELATGYSEASKHMFMVYLGSDGNEQELGWNVIDATPQNGHGVTSRCLQIHSSPTTSDPPNGFPMWGLHIHDNVMTGCGGYAINFTADPGKGSGIEFYNNLVYHTGACDNWAGMQVNRFLLYTLATLDFNWAATSGKFKFYNNTVYDVNSCNPSSNGLFMGPAGGSSAPIKPPVNQTICSSSCSTRQSGTLPPTDYTPYYNPHGVTFQTTYPEAGKQSIVDDGNGNLTQEGQIVGTINYSTGDYDFTFLRAVPAASQVLYRWIWEYRVEMKNNIIYLKAGEPVFYTHDGFHQMFEMDHNLFYNEAGTGTGGPPTWPIKVTNPVGNNSDPMFVSPATGDFHLKPGSPAIGSGADTGIAWDFDGNPRTANDIGAFAFGSTSASLSQACDINGDGKVDNNDITAAISQTTGGAACGSAGKLGTSGCNVAAIQRVINAVHGGDCRVQ
jgi:hypothetical protein